MSQIKNLTNFICRSHLFWLMKTWNELSLHLGNRLCQRGGTAKHHLYIYFELFYLIQVGLEAVRKRGECGVTGQGNCWVTVAAFDRPAPPSTVIPLPCCLRPIVVIRTPTATIVHKIHFILNKWQNWDWEQLFSSSAVEFSEKLDFLFLTSPDDLVGRI